MRRTVLCLILLCASSLAFGRDARPSGDVGDCRDSVITVPSPTQVPVRKPASVMHKAKPAAVTTHTSGGGGTDDSAGMPRVPRWHSLLPGMFR